MLEKCWGDRENRQSPKLVIRALLNETTRTHRFPQYFPTNISIMYAGAHSAYYKIWLRGWRACNSWKRKRMTNRSLRSHEEICRANKRMEYVINAIVNMPSKYVLHIKLNSHIKTQVHRCRQPQAACCWRIVFPCSSLRFVRIIVSLRQSRLTNSSR